MSVVSVRARSFILALFIRDDGERFLLGDKGFDFKDSQLHFAANTIENDEVAKQGVDGVMLAGQVRRASVQSFDGYVGDATMLKEEIEQMRREFFAFFASGHHFRVVYIDCNRNAWQRKGGYLVDAPEVKELWQIHPEYHVGLNFEDVNYYGYDENAEGEEILSNIISVPISSDVEGGLVWDENGAVSEPAVIEYDAETASASGMNISILDAAAAPLSSFSISGNTVQNGTPTPDAPVAVQTVTGENVVKISDGQGNEQSYEVNLGKNLFDKDNVNVRNGYLYNNKLFYRTSYGDRSFILSCEPNTTYTISRSVKTGSFRAAYSATAPSAIPANDSSTTQNINCAGEIDNNSGTSISITTGDAAKSLIVHYGNTVRDSNIGQSLATIQVEKGSTATSYAAYFEPIELCKLGNYQDYIYKSGGKWYAHKEVGKADAGSITGWVWDSAKPRFHCPTSQLVDNGIYPVFPESNSAAPVALVNSYRVGSFTDIYTNTNTGFTMSSSGKDWQFINTVSGWTSADQARASLSGVYVYYALATPTDTEITNEALVAQLEAILSQGYTYAGTNNITTVISAGNVQGELEITYYTKYDAKVVSGGYVWEAGGEGGPTIVMNESISEVSPVWTVFGPALNPVLENTTTGEQIEYVGMIGEGQTLVVDMGEQTASLDGLNVISNIVGDYLTLAPGSNTLLFSAESAAPASQIGWSEIVG